LLDIALEIGNNESVKLLLAGGAKPDQINSVRKVTPIHLAAAKGDPFALKVFASNIDK
jgi:ankyrin repeat protein